MPELTSDEFVELEELYQVVADGNVDPDTAERILALEAKEEDDADV